VLSNTGPWRAPETGYVVAKRLRATVVSGGLASSTVLTLIVLPALRLMFAVNGNCGPRRLAYRGRFAGDSLQTNAGFTGSRRW
jgi:hypothetical protein